MSMEKSLTFFFHISFQLLYINSHVSFFFFYCQKVTEKKKPGIEHMYMYRYIHLLPKLVHVHASHKFSVAY